MLERREITRETLSPLLRLKVRPDQDHLVAPNAMTIAQAAYEQPGAYVWGLWTGDAAVGLVAMIHPLEYRHLEPGDDPEGAYIWRLMIAAEHQGKGLGGAAIGECLAQARAWGLPRLATSVVDSSDSNIGFYERLGFRRTGAIVDGEIVLSREV
ncbi:GNAT family N-acetyltransferase [Sinisalibacter aestuarii]|uniref:N-acetyltransferase n=1 Tax=Sinisalibacter aestuarii TaxID=2949426 RepID=A0ABQ5LQX0_9RHOB|nr:GNAT family N-acetyltransferase [Sinisalibacter aestuarii]GKY86467.1 N-acetyltransferase [Sinisalibacter aestuarii]